MSRILEEDVVLSGYNVPANVSNKSHFNFLSAFLVAMVTGGLKGLKGLHHAICYIFSKLRRVFASIEFQKKAQFYYLRLHVILASKLFLVVCCLGLGWRGWKCIKTF